MTMKTSKKKNKSGKTKTMSNSNTRTGQVVAAAVIGAAAGAIAGLLMAPSSGKETFENVNRKANKFKNDFTDQVKEYASMGKEKFDELTNMENSLSSNNPPKNGNTKSSSQKASSSSNTNA